jgi:two-component system sensor histidine kinase/response regulator
MAGEKILVVEDDAALLNGLRDILELAGFEIRTASNGVEGLAALETFTPQLIVSDIMMPKLDGYRFFEEVRSRPEWISLPFIFLTAKAEKPDIRRGKQLGVDDYVTKPFEEEDLLVTIRSKLNRHTQLLADRDRQIAGLKRTILNTLNHEFRTPLTYIATYSDLLREAGPEVSAEELKMFMRGIQSGSERLRRLVEDFILLVELQTGEAQETYARRREAMNQLPVLLHTLLAQHTARATARGVKLVADIPVDLPAILADSEYLSSAISRLLENAIKFSKREGGQVTLSARADNNRLRIQVKDEGIGIRAEEKEKIFDLFYQIDRAKMEQQGSGSGLAIARGIVKMHGGTLSVESTPGVGSTFTIELPAAS